MSKLNSPRKSPVNTGEYRCSWRVYSVCVL